MAVEGNNHCLLLASKEISKFTAWIKFSFILLNRWYLHYHSALKLASKLDELMQHTRPHMKAGKMVRR
jgi:hypothetical protein